MSIDKSPVLVGTDPITNLPVYRRYLESAPSRDKEVIKIYYSEFFVSNSAEIHFKHNNYKFVIIKDFIIGDIINGDPIDHNYSGFTNFYNTNVGGLPAGTKLFQLLVSKANTILSQLSIDIDNGYTLTQDY